MHGQAQWRAHKQGTHETMAAGVVAGTRQVQSSLWETSPCILRGCKREDGKVGDKFKGKFKVVARDCVSNDVLITSHVTHTDIKGGTRTSINGGYEKLVV